MGGHATQQRTCQYTEPGPAFGEIECSITGASITDDCGRPREAGGDADALDCLPKKILRYARGERRFLAGVSGPDRQVILAQAPRVMARLQAGKVRLEGEARSAMAEEREPNVGPLDLTAMSVEELEALAKKADRAARERKRQQADMARIVEPLRERKVILEQQLDSLEVALERVEHGKPLGLTHQELKALGVRLRRRVPQAAPTPDGRKAAVTKPDRTRIKAETMIRTAARRYHWSPERLAERLAAL